jgi:hypothetical protein
MPPAGFGVSTFAGATMHFWFNACEAAFWVVVGAVVIVRSRAAPSRVRRVGLIAGLAFFAFAGTDLVELRTGAWYRPWWLLVYNALCITTLAACYGAYLPARKSRQ